MKIVFAVIMCLVSAPAFAIVYTLDASNAIQSGNLTDGNAHWSGFEQQRPSCVPSVMFPAIRLRSLRHG